MSSPLAGAWQMVSDTHDGIAVFSDTYYSIVMAEKNRAKFKADKPTEAEAAEAYRTLSTAAGSYEIVGTTLVFHRVVNRNPSGTGGDLYFEFTLDNEQLTMEGTPNRNDPWRWQKVQ